MTGPTNPSVTITVRENGSYLVEGPVRLLDAGGNEYDLGGKSRFSLCRCGGSTRKPFCDGTHSRIGFQGAERAVEEAERAGG
jgi:CDGSH-type Zn-finger protein